MYLICFRRLFQKYSYLNVGFTIAFSKNKVKTTKTAMKMPHVIKKLACSEKTYSYLLLALSQKCDKDRKPLPF